MRRVVLGTAGHIDHGKTALIKLLTGYDCDRLPEEKARGITIELGFTHMTLPDSTQIGIVDVPGHERFVRTMVSGAAGIDMVMLVVAADEGIMPQTVEHLAICKILGIRRGLIAVTKADLADEDLLLLVHGEIESLVSGTFLERAPIVNVSSVTGQGKDELTAAIARVAEQVAAKTTDGVFRLPIDRVFTMKGFGTVVTGTCISGCIKTGEEVAALPSGLATRIRGIQVHSEPVEEAFAGQRVAINLQGVERDQVERGDMLIRPGSISATYMCDVMIEILPSCPRPLRYRSRTRMHVFTREAMARVIPMSAEVLEPGSSGWGQLRLEEPLVLAPGDRFVLRSYSPMTTIGGGAVVHPCPVKHKRPFEETVHDLEILHSGDSASQIMALIRQSAGNGIALQKISFLTRLSQKEISETIKKLSSQGDIARFDQEQEAYASTTWISDFGKKAVDFIAAYHRKNPMAAGPAKSAVMEAMGKNVNPKLSAKILAGLIKEGRAIADVNTVHLPSHDPAAVGLGARIRQKILEKIEAAGLEAPIQKELIEIEPGREKEAEEILNQLTAEGLVVRAGLQLYFSPKAIDQAAQKVAEYLQTHDKIDAQGFKALFGLSRKYTIPLGEHLDELKVTLRIGDARILRKKSGVG